MQRFLLPPSWFVVALGFLLVGEQGAHAQQKPRPAPAPPNGVYEKQPDPPVDPSKDKALYTVAYAHLDTQWRWTYPQVIREYLADTLHSNFKFFEKYPDYVFNFSGSRRYEMMREYYPDDYEKLKGYVASGQWFPCGSSVDEGDANVPDLESFIRHVLYGNRYFKAEFNKTSSEFMLPDCFGFPASLPSMLAHCGIKGFSTQKLTWGSAVGIPFKVGTWIGPDGKSITAALDPGSYGGGINEDLSHNQSWLTRINHTGEASGAFVDYHYYGTGDRGGTPKEEAVKWLETSLSGGGPVRVVSATAERMFNDLTEAQKAKLPTYKGELLLTEHSAGSVTSEAYMKRWNRKNELLASAAERASVSAMLLGAAPYPTRKLYEGWDLLLGSQMHDMLPGTSLPRAYEYCWNDEILAANFFSAVEEDGVGAVAGAMDTTPKEGGVPLLVYNPLALERDDLVEATVALPGNAAGDIEVLDPAGKAVPAQILGHGEGAAHILFEAQLPSVGFATYTARSVGKSEAATSPLKVSEKGLENARYRVAINENGDVSSVFDKANNEELLAGPTRLEFQYERPKQFPAWNMDWDDQQKPPAGFVDGPATVRVVENGPARVAVEITRDARGSHFVQVIRLAAGSAGDRVEFANTIDWQTQECCLKQAFPMAHANPMASYEDKVGVPVRGNNDPKKYEVPQQQWFDLTGADGKYGVGVLNDSKFGSDKPDDKTMRLTLIYTPAVRNDYQDQATQDFGRHQIVYALAGHAGDWRAGKVPAQAARLNQPLAVFQTAAHPGKLGREFSLLRINSGQVAVAAVKKAEDGDEIVVRLKELNGTAASDVEVSGSTAITAAREINGQELPVGEATVREGKLVTTMGPFGLKAFALKFAPLPTQVEAPRSQAVTLAYDTDAVSSQKNRADGGFGHDGVTYPAEQFPKRLESEGVGFQLGSTADGEKNAVLCKGQTISLPAGDYDHVYLLASAQGGMDVDGKFKLGDQEATAIVQDWSAFVGQWDRRLWKGEVPELTYGWHNELAGLVPGFTKRDNVAWYASHRHNPKEKEYYQYCYLFKYGFELPAGARQITLPNDPRIGVFAVSVAKTTHAEVHPARVLYDDLRYAKASNSGAAQPTKEQAAASGAENPAGPHIRPAGGKFNDGTMVTIVHPMYWEAGNLHYTTDGSEPTESSPVYSGPFRLSAAATVRAKVVWPQGQPGTENQAVFELNDTVRPQVTGVSTLAGLPQVSVRFSEPVTRESGETAANYHFNPAAEVISAKVSADGESAVLTLAQPLAPNQHYLLDTRSVKDLSPNGNPTQAAPLEVHANAPIFTLESFVANGKESKTIEDKNLPTGANDAWTINCFVRTDKPLENRTIIAGFGKVKDDGGHGRYLTKFANGLHFWCADQDVETSTSLKVGVWQMLTASFDGHTLTVYHDGKQVGQSDITLVDDDAKVELAPLDPWDQEQRFAGEIKQMKIWNSAVDASTVALLNQKQP